MPIETSCPSCASRFRFADETAGKQASCQKCGALFAIPSAPADAPPATAVSATPPPPLAKPVAAPKPDDEILTPKLVRPAPRAKRPRTRSSEPAAPKRAHGPWIAAAVAGFLLLVGGVALFMLFDLVPGRGGFAGNFGVKKEERAKDGEPNRNDFRKDDMKDDFPFPNEEKKIEEKPIEEKKIGVEINDLVVGTGRQAAVGDVLQVKFVGELMDGTEVDRTPNSQQGFRFTLGTGSVIKGWDLGIVGMRVGGLRRLTIASPLAYGELTRPRIPANSTLVFEIELLSIE
jgi:FKBP-type peptidyl-prolyl cis-trans isomerase